MSILFDGWEPIVRVVVVGTLAYAAFVAVLRWSGKRTLSKMNAFDLIVTVALGSALATTMLSKTTALAEGVTALVLLVLLQMSVTWLSVRSERFQAFIKAEPRLLLHQGRMIGEAMRAERVSEEEVRAAVRASGNASLEACTVVLETDGTLSVVSGASRGDDASALEGVSGKRGA